MRTENQIETPCFAMVSYDNVILTQNIEELMAVISQRQYFYCEVAVLNEVEEATRYAAQKYYSMFQSNPFLSEVTPMPLPSPESQQTYNLKSHRLTTEINEQQESDKILGLTLSGASPSSFNLMYPQYNNPAIFQNSVAESFWSVEAINGYAVADDLNKLAYFLTRLDFIYPRAVPYQNEILASINARGEFINRFARRYGFESESLESLPIIASGHYFVDEFHQEREIRRRDNATMQNLLEFGLL